MANPRLPFRINVGFIVHEEVGSSHDFNFDFEKIQVSNDLDLRNFHGSALIGRTPQGLFLQGNFSGEITLDCVRCLSRFHQTIHWGMTELFAFNQKSVTDSGLILPEDAHIDLQPLVREYALLEVPIYPLCKPGCKGLCSVCGQDRNVRDCGHRPQENESPFSSLKNLF